ncbi:Disulfide bond formation protein DsbA [Azospirillaceae bacterium]
MLVIDVYGDLICPLCYLGSQRLQKALNARKHVATRHRWRPFRLHPDVPEEGLDRDLYSVIRFGTMEKARQVYAAIEDMATRDGVQLNLSQIRRLPNSLQAHCLILFAERFHCGPAAIQEVFAAYFGRGQDIGEIDVLLEVAARIGLDTARTRSALEGNEEKENVLLAEARSRQVNLQALPCCVFNERYALAGVQDSLCYFPLLDLLPSDRLRS